jgi:hypothetical protein
MRHIGQESRFKPVRFLGFFKLIYVIVFSSGSKDENNGKKDDQACIYINDPGHFRGIFRELTTIIIFYKKQRNNVHQYQKKQYNELLSVPDKKKQGKVNHEKVNYRAAGIIIEYPEYIDYYQRNQ